MIPPRDGTRKPLWRTLLGPVAALIVLALAIGALKHIADTTSWPAVAAALNATPTHRLLLAASFAAASYVVLIAYDALAVSHLGYRLPLKTVAVASFTSFTMSHTLGLTALTGGTVRYRLYTRVGVRPLDIALIVLLCGWTFWLGIVTVAGVGLIASPELAAPFGHVVAHAERWAGLALLAGAAAYIVLATLYRRPLRLGGVSFTLPDLRQTLLQVVVGAVDLALAASALYVLLPEQGLSTWLAVCTIYAVAMVIGALSHAPGGLGFFEYVIASMMIAAPKPQLVAALILFRVIYTFIPFVLGLLLLAATEWAALRRRQRASPAP